MKARPTPALVIAGVSLLGLSLTACGSADDAATTASSVVEEVDSGDEVLDLASEAEQLSQNDLEAAIGDEDVATLFTVLDVAGFDDVAEAEAFTLFAPNDSAFAALDQDLLANLLADPASLRDILQDHLLDEVVTAAELPADGTTVTANGGLELGFDLSGDVATVNGIPILRTDISVGDRGVVHVIDGLLLEE